MHPIGETVSRKEKSGQVVVFDIWSNFAYFRRPYTTTNALTYNFIPRSSIEGLIGAILGIPITEVSDKVSNSKIGLGILNPIKKIPFSTIHTHTDFWFEMQAYLEGKSVKKKDFRARVSLELLVEPKYRVYFSDPNLGKELEEMLKKHETIFTPYLGTSTMLADFTYIGTFDYNVAKRATSELSSIIPYRSSIIPYRDRFPDIAVEKQMLYAVEQDIPGRISKDRDLLSTYYAVYSPEGKKIKVRNTEVNAYTDSSGEQNFVFIPA